MARPHATSPTGVPQADQSGILDALRDRRLRWSLMGVAAGGALLAAAWVRRPAPAAAPAPEASALRLTPAALDLSGRVFRAGETVEALFTLENASDGPVEVVAIRSSCGNRVLGVEQDLAFPLRLGPGQRRPFQVLSQVGSHQGGPQSFFAQAIVRTAGGGEAAGPLAVAHFEADAGLRPLPAEVVVPTYPGTLPIRKVVYLVSSRRRPASTADRLRFETPPWVEVACLPIEVPPAAGGSTVQPRHRIELTMTPPADETQRRHEVRITEDGHPLGAITVHLEPIRPYVLAPAVVEFSARPGSTSERIVYLEAIDPGYAELGVGPRDAGLGVRIEPVSETIRRVVLSYRVPADGPPDEPLAVELTPARAGLEPIRLALRFDASAWE